MTAVLVLQRILPQYRAPFFERFGAMPGIQLYVAYGESAPGTALRSVEPPAMVRAVRLRNRYWLFRGREIVVYQHGATRAAGDSTFDVVIAEFNPRIISNLLALIATKWRGGRFIWWGHGFGPRTSPIAAHLRLWLARRADAVVFYEVAQAERFVSMGFPRARAVVATNSIDTETISPLVSQAGPSERRTLLYIGRLIPGKKVDLLLRAFALAQQQLRTIKRVTIIGDGPERSRLEGIAQKLGIRSAVDFTGEIFDQKALARYFNSALASVSPGYVGLSAVHSLAFGVPMIVARDEPHRPEIAALEGNDTAVFVPSNDPEAFARAFETLERDHDTWRNMSALCRELAERRFGVGQMAQAFAKLLGGASAA